MLTTEKMLRVAAFAAIAVAGCGDDRCDRCIDDAGRSDASAPRDATVSRDGGGPTLDAPAFDSGPTLDGGGGADGSARDARIAIEAGPSTLPPECPALVVLADDFETGDLSGATGIGAWGGGSGETGAAPRVATDIARSGTQSLRFTFLGSADLADDAWSEQRFDMRDPLTDVCVEWFMYMPDGTEGLGARFAYRDATGPDNNKLLRLWDEDYNDYRLKVGWSMQRDASSAEDPRIITEHGINRGGVGPFGSRSWFGITDALRGRWVRFVAHVRVDSGAGDGILDLWVDDAKVIENDAIAMYPAGAAGNYMRRGYLLGWANTGFTETTYIYVDDVRITGAI